MRLFQKYMDKSNRGWEGSVLEMEHNEISLSESRKGLLRQRVSYMKEESSSMSTETAPAPRLNHVA